jgi:hypothetical protein
MIKMINTEVRTFSHSLIMELSDGWFAAKESEKFVVSFFGVVHEEPHA